MHPHLTFAHDYWTHLVQPGDTVIDATCGNGHDALYLAKLALREELPNKLYVIDLQEKAIEATHQRLACHLSATLLQKVIFLQSCHSKFPAELPVASVKLIIYNLGYLPGADKTLTTKTETTLASLFQAMNLIQPGGALCITCYPGHPEGEKEEEAVLKMASSLDFRRWSCCHHRWVNRQKAPSLLIVKSHSQCE